MVEPQTEVEKRPREYAAEILQLRDRADRADALQAVPDHLQAMVRLYVEIHFQCVRGGEMADIKTEQQIDRIAEEWLSRILYDICTEEFPSDEYDEWISEQYEYYVKAFKGQFRKALKDVERLSK